MIKKFQQWFKQVWAILHARNLEFIRDKSALTWTIAFPLLMIVAIYIGFSDMSKYSFKVGILGETTELKQEFLSLPIADLSYVRYINYTDESAGLKSLNRFGVDMLIDPIQKQYWFNQQSKEGYFLDQLIQRSLAGNFVYTRNVLENTAVRYIDWAWIGIVVINIMYGCFYGIGYVIVRYRKNGHLKRLEVTPMTASQFLLAQVMSRLSIVFVSSSLVVLGCYFILHPMISPSIDYMSLGLVVLLGTLSFISLGLLLSARGTSEEFSRGIIEVVAWPMLVGSGAWFSLEGAHPWFQMFSNVLPATHFIHAARQLVLYGATFSDIMPEIAFLAGSTVIFFAIGMMLFKWQSGSTWLSR